MSDESAAELLRRIEALEETVRLLEGRAGAERRPGGWGRTALACLGCVLGTVALLGTIATVGFVARGRNPWRLEAKALVIRDPSAMERITIATAPDGAAFFVMNDASGGRRIQIASAADNMPTVSLFDGADHRRVGLALLSNGGAVFNAYDDQGRMRVMLGVNDKQVPSIRLYDPAQAGWASLSVGDEDAGLEVVKGKVQRLFAGMRPGGAVGFSVGGPDNSLRVGISDNPDGSAGVLIRSRQGTQGVEMGLDRDDALHFRAPRGRTPEEIKKQVLQ